MKNSTNILKSIYNPISQRNIAHEVSIRPDKGIKRKENHSVISLMNTDIKIQNKIL